MGLTVSSGGNARYTNAVFDKGIGKFIADNKETKEAVAAIKSSIGFEDKHGYSKETSSKMLKLLEEQNIPTFGGASGKLEGVEVYDNKDSRYYKVRVSEEAEDGKKEYVTLTMSVSNTGGRNNGHVAGLIASINQLKVGDNVDVSVWMAQAKKPDGTPVVTHNGDEIYNASSFVKKDGEKVSIAGKTLITKETFAEKRANLEKAGLDKEQVQKAIDSDEVKLIMAEAHKQAESMPFRTAKAESDSVPYAGKEESAEDEANAEPAPAKGADWD